MPVGLVRPTALPKFAYKLVYLRSTASPLGIRRARSATWRQVTINDLTVVGGEAEELETFRKS